MKKVAGVGVVGIVVVAVLFFLKNGFGFGNGSGFGEGANDASAQQETQVESTQESVEETEAIESVEEHTDVVIVTIREKKVIVGEQEFENEEAFKAYLEEIHTDSGKYELQEENSIQATYEWVVKVFEDLSIEYTVTNK